MGTMREQRDWNLYTIGCCGCCCCFLFVTWIVFAAINVDGGSRFWGDWSKWDTVLHKQQNIYVGVTFKNVTFDIPCRDSIGHAGTVSAGTQYQEENVWINFAPRYPPIEGAGTSWFDVWWPLMLVYILLCSALSAQDLVC